MENKPLYIFDLDGTLVLIDHRRHFVESTPKRWREFYDACDRDTPNRSVVDTALALYHAGAEIWIWSGRSDEVRYKTEVLLKSCLPQYAVLKMRTAGDYQPDVSLKRSWLEDMDPADRARLVAVFDDRSSVVDMWREQGVSCFQVAKGDF